MLLRIRCKKSRNRNFRRSIRIDGAILLRALRLAIEHSCDTCLRAELVEDDKHHKNKQFLANNSIPQHNVAEFDWSSRVIRSYESMIAERTICP